MTDPQTKKKIIRINPELSEDLLQEVIVETRAIIINLYLTCETDFSNGIKLYEAIVGKKIIETSKNQIKTTEDNMEKLVSDEDIPKPAELVELKKIADKRIREQKERVSKEADKIQKEQDKIDVVSPIIQEPVEVVKEAVKEVVKEAVKEEPKEEPKEAVKEEPKEVVAPIAPQIKVKINVQGQGEGQGQGQEQEQTAGSRKYKQKSKNKKTRGKRAK